MEEIESRILEEAQRLFLLHGVRGVTMDDMAGNLGMSKKTLYQYFTNKADLVLLVATSFIEAEKIESDRVIQEASNAIDQEFRLLRWSSRVFGRMNPNLISEVQRFYPQAWEVFNQFKQEFLFKKIVENLRRGVKEGLYRPELNLDLIATLRIAQIESNLQRDSSFLLGHSFDHINLVLFDLYMRSIVTDRGRSLLLTYLKTIQVPMGQ